jgi:hypothetical protein
LRAAVAVTVAVSPVAWQAVSTGCYGRGKG